LNLIKNDDVDEEASLTYLENQLKDATWLKLVKDAFKTCHKEMPKFYPEIQKRAKFTKEQCDVKYDVITDCINSETFIVSLKVKPQRNNFIYNFLLGVS
jgi:hypothetical protein